jgi:hypothetical protein
MTSPNPKMPLGIIAVTFVAGIILIAAFSKSHKPDAHDPGNAPGSAPSQEIHTNEGQKNLAARAAATAPVVAPTPPTEQENSNAAARVTPTTVEDAADRAAPAAMQRTSSEMTEALKAQQQLLDKKAAEKSKDKFVESTLHELEDRTIAMYYRVYKDLKVSGIAMADPRPDLLRANNERKQEGIWETVFEQPFDDSNFLLIGDFVASDPYFSIAGYGGIELRGELVGDNYSAFTYHGVFPRNCKFGINVPYEYEGHLLKYDCAAYLAGTMDSKVQADVKAIILKKLSTETQERIVHKK